MVTIKQAYEDIVNNFNEYFGGFHIVDRIEESGELAVYFDKRKLPKKYRESKRFEEAFKRFMRDALDYGMEHPEMFEEAS